MDRIAELRAKLAAELTALQGLIDADEFDAEAVEKAQAACQSIKDEIEKRERLQKLTAALQGEVKRGTPEGVDSPNPNPDGDDDKARIDADYKAATYVQSMPASWQANTVLERCGENVRAEARAQEEAFAAFARQGLDRIAFYQEADTDAINALQALAEGADATGGTVVPDAFIPTPIHDPGQPGGRIRAAATVIPVNGLKGTQPSFGAMNFGYVAEGGAIPDADPGFGEIAWQANKVAAKVDISWELFEDSAIDLVAGIATASRERIGVVEDINFIGGDGSGKPEGILNGSKVTRVRTGGVSRFNDEDVRALLAAIPEQFDANASVLIPKGGLFAVRGGDYGAQRPGRTEDDLFGGLHGYPTILVGGGTTAATTLQQGAPTARNQHVAIAGDLRVGYAVFDRRGLTIRRDDSVASGNGLNRIYVWARNDGRVALANALRAMQTAAS